MRRVLGWMAAVTMTLFLAACGGGGGNSGNCQLCGGNGGSGSSAVAELRVGPGAQQIDLQAPTAVTVTITAVNASNQVVADAPVVLVADNGAKITTAASVTDASGQLAATVELGAASAVGPITVTATSGSVTGTGMVSVVDSGTAVADLILTATTRSINNSGGDAVTVTALAVDSNRNTVAKAPVQVTVDANAVVTPGATQTDTSGKLASVVGIGADKTNRVINFTAVSGSVTKVLSIQVVGAKLSASYAGTVAPGSSGNLVTLLLTDANAVPMSGQAVSVSAPGLSSASGTTDAAGSFVYSYTAPGVAGSLTITATGGGTSVVAAVQVQSTGAVPAAVGPVSSASVAVAPKTVATNLNGSTSNQAQVRALFMGTGNTPVPNIRVRFDLAGDVNNVGGAFSAGSTLYYSGADGSVTTAYIPGTRSSPTDGVTIRACWDYTDFAVGACPNATTTLMTVTAEPISVAVGTNELITESADKLSFIKDFVVFVVDSAGVAMPGVSISPVLDLINYGKGHWSVSTKWSQTVNAICSNEDANRNGVLDAGEDVNGNGKLEPRKADAKVSALSSVTDADGRATMRLEYLKTAASWDQIVLTVTATGISGTEGTATYTSWLWVPASDLSNTSVAPAYVSSPYGDTSSCSNPN